MILASVPARSLIATHGDSSQFEFDSAGDEYGIVCPIEEVTLGARIASKNPNRSDIDNSLPELDSTWKLVQMQFQRKNGSRVDLELLRPVEWIKRHRLEAGDEIFMSNAEIEVRGTGRVLAIEECPPIADGQGSIVIARIKTHHAGNLVELQFENGETLTGTARHPIGSADRQDWVPLGELQEGEHTQSRDGLLRIVAVTALPDIQPVYNLEVHGEHVYEVTHAGVLVHNNTPDCLRLDALRKLVAEGTASADDLAEIAALEKKLLEDLSKLGAASGPNGLSKAGHSLTKHNSIKRPGSFFPDPTGNPAQINQQAQKALDDILGNADRVITQRGNRLQVRLPSGTGVIYKWDGARWVFSHFAENLY